jgi:hypothetical protein
MDLDRLDRWVVSHQPDPSCEYAYGWWHESEFVRMLRDRHRLKAVDVPATYWMETPPLDPNAPLTTQQFTQAI